jgi:hypothetical protein
MENLYRSNKPSLYLALIFFLQSLFFTGLRAENKVVVYPVTAGADLSSDFRVFADNREVAVYRIPAASMDDTWRCAPYSLAGFDFTGEVTVKVFPARGAKILPVTKALTSMIRNDTLIIRLVSNCNISIEPAGNSEVGPLLLFANPIEINPPRQDDQNVIYFKPGIYKTNVTVGGNKTLYIAGGAVITGGLEAYGDNITIRGRGIVDGFPFGGGGIKIHGKNIRMEGITFKSPSGWCIVSDATDSLSIINVKVCGNRGVRSDDAIDLVNCRNVLIRDCFLRVWDDPIAIKGMEHPSVPDSAIVIEKCTLWTDGANVFRIGCECTAKAMENIIIRDIDVIHAHSRRSQDYPLWLISLQPAENMPIRDLLFENIRVNWEGQKYLIDVRPQVTKWSTPPEGSIKNIVFRNIDISGSFSDDDGVIIVSGAGSDHPVENVRFENVRRNGKCYCRESKGVTVGADASGIIFTCPGK